MGILQDVTSDINTVFGLSELAVAMSYTAGTVTVTGVPVIQQSMEAYSKQLTGQISDCSTFFVQQSVLNTAGVTPDLYHTLTDGVDTWRVEGIRVSTAGYYAFLVVKNQRLQAKG